MRIKNIYCILIITLSVICVSCSKWLDTKPKSQISEAALFENEQGFKDALIGVYVKLASRELYAKEFTMGLVDVLARQYDVDATSSAYYQAGQYEYKDISTQAKINTFWINAYSAIANLNNLLEAINGKESLFTHNNYQIIKGEAFALRALVHFDLLRAFGPVPTLGMDNASIPYVTTFDMDVKKALPTGTILEKCLADLDTAKSLLSVRKEVVTGISDIFLSNTRNHMNYWAVIGLMARINLYRGATEAAYSQSMEVIQSGLFPFITSEEVSAVSSPNRTFTMEQLFGIYVSNLTDINAELFKSSSLSQLLTTKEDAINQIFDVSSGGSTDYRYLYLWKTEGASGIKYPAKYWQDDITNSNFRNRVPVIKLAEMYFIAAETAPNQAASISLLNQVRQNRGQQLLSAELSKSNLSDELTKSYQKEFYQEGQLFYYYKRKNVTQLSGYPSPITPAIYQLPQPDDEKEFNP
ncbi:SusD family protein [bacterium A37T11]|nr:SusD family protein [bacterium A37T11]